MGVISKAKRVADVTKKAVEATKKAAEVADEYVSIGGSGAVRSDANRKARGEAGLARAAASAAMASEKRSRRSNEQSAKLTPKRGSIAKKTSVSATDIKQATTKNAVSKYIREIKDAAGDKPSESQKMRLAMAEKKLEEIEKEQSSEVARAGRKSAQSARDRKAPKVSLKAAPFEYARGGSVMRKKKC